MFDTQTPLTANYQYPKKHAQIHSCKRFETVSSASTSDFETRRPVPTPAASPSARPERSKCIRTRLSIYARRSLRRIDSSLLPMALTVGRVCSFGRSCATIARRAGSWERIKVVFVVKTLPPPTFSIFAAGSFVKNERSRLAFVSEACGAEPATSVADCWTLDKTARSWERMASFCAYSCLSARWSFRVSRSFLRRRSMDSGVGASGSLESDRFLLRSQRQRVTRKKHRTEDTHRVMV